MLYDPVSKVTPAIKLSVDPYFVIILFEEVIPLGTTTVNALATSPDGGFLTKSIWPNVCSPARTCGANEVKTKTIFIILINIL